MGQAALKNKAMAIRGTVFSASDRDRIQTHLERGEYSADDVSKFLLTLPEGKLLAAIFNGGWDRGSDGGRDYAIEEISAHFPEVKAEYQRRRDEGLCMALGCTEVVAPCICNDCAAKEVVADESVEHAHAVPGMAGTA